jgi:alpha-amylase
MISRNAIMMNVKSTDVILHAFDWPYQLVAKRAKQIAQAGYKAVLVSPPIKSEMHKNGTPWWQRYQPQDYRVIENQLGDTHDFKKMVASLEAYDLWPYIDVVFNHMANESQIRADLQYPSDAVMKRYAKNPSYYRDIALFGDLSTPLFDENEFFEAFGIHDWHDPWQVQHGRITGGPHDQGLPTLAPTDKVVAQQREYLLAMKALGVKGFRIDAAKHLTMEHLQKVWSDDITHDVHIFGEIITDGGATAEEYQLFLKPYLEKTELAAYDFPLFQTLFNALTASGDLSAIVDPYCFGQALSKSRAITFAVTHDIPNNDVFHGLIMEEWAEHIAYSYLLGRDGGVPLIYSDLNSSHIQSESGMPRWQGVWNSKDMIARIKFHNQMHGLEMKLLASQPDLLAFSRGDQGVVVLNKSDQSQLLILDRSQPLTDLLSGKCFVVIENQLHIEIPPKQSYLLATSEPLTA